MSKPDAEQLSQRRARGKLSRLIRFSEAQLATLRPYYEDYVRLHRLLYDCDPEPDEVGVEAKEEA